MVVLVVVLGASLVSLLELQYMANVASTAAISGLRLAINEDIRGLSIELMLEDSVVLGEFAHVLLPFDRVPWRELVSQTRPASVHITLPSKVPTTRSLLQIALDRMLEAQRYFALNSRNTFAVPVDDTLEKVGTCLRVNRSLCRSESDPLHTVTSRGLDSLVLEYVARGEAVMRARSETLSPKFSPVVDLEALYNAEMLDGLLLSLRGTVTSIDRNASWKDLPLYAFLFQLLVLVLFFAFAIVPMIRMLRANNRQTFFMLGLIPHAVVTTVHSVAEYFELDV
ncbi:uncharacterized protein AMSG_11688 [Thecamonas trahens ATCC 50062]|uniref:Uncharacterized protein n=1 Tax=Thecamonas trahens ATCC 50062 TaxID=461836 RepID=A0A0L0DVM5_THETB|nr:hypothetical protein AMSG_11688 [Thecamonas trahens ATCC 50062]KNC56126.1 hypothetical protein AMSG_11688 [Thecamonas trahens ATCC 50062]|eukprot:XP_013761227.1 hypothetical protein AMSG_11688 [Thecamonas trahens ATCC 50062]